MSRENLIVFPDITSVTKNLESGAIDVSIVQGPSQELSVKDRSLVIIGTIPVSDTYAVAFRKTNPELSARVNNSLIQLMNDPYWQQLKEKYGLTGTDRKQ
jgi:ABC-type amino acid transport substrate-binding protein